MRSSGIFEMDLQEIDMKKIAVIGAGILFLLGAVIFMPRDISISASRTAASVSEAVPQLVLPSVPEATSGQPSDTPSTTTPPIVPAHTTTPSATPDVPAQQLDTKPNRTEGFYMTAWIAGIPSRVDALIAKAKARGINTFIVDVKDYSGYVSYRMDIPEVIASGADKQIRIAHPNDVLTKLHQNGMYAIARVTVFQDPILAAAHPEWAMQDKETGRAWKDQKGLSWMDPAAQPVWDYDIAIAKDAIARGFDEVNFDYVRFPSDGSLSRIAYPAWDGKEAKHAVLRRFFKYVSGQLPNAVISADVFGLVTVNSDDLGIGQVLEDTYGYFDYVSPMVYPSHYAKGFLGYKNPAEYPYEVIHYSMTKAVGKLYRFEQLQHSTTTPAEVPGPRATKLRPWFQAFDLGADYTNDMIHKQMQAFSDVIRETSASQWDGGWLLWDPNNTYSNYAG